jgi:predicted MFS family arabinose efflux permease
MPQEFLRPFFIFAVQKHPRMNVSANIPKLYLIKTAKWFMLFMPYVVPFYEWNGFGMKEVLLLQAIYSVTIVVMEIPSGYLADVFGRKKTLVLGSVLGFGGFLCYAVGSGFWGFLLAEVILGIGQSFISGADSALMYDSLKEMKKEKEYIRYEGRLTSAGNISEAVAAFLAFIPAAISLRAPYVAQTFVAFLAVPAAMMLVEPGHFRRQTGLRMKNILMVVKYAVSDHREMRRNIFFSSVIGAATLTMAWFAQRFFGVIRLDLEYYSPAWAILNLTTGLFSYMAYRIERRLGMKRSLLLITLLIPTGYIFLGFNHSYLGLIILWLFYIVRGFATPVLKDYINRITESKIRATVLSVRNFIIRLLFASTAPFFGWIADAWSFQSALLVSGGMFMLLGGVTLVLFLRSAR